jgi:hypothetical protein
VTSTARQSPPRVGEEWQKNGTDRVVLIEDTTDRYAHVLDIHTGRRSRIDLYAFTRQGRTGWTRIKEAPRDDL